MFGQKSAKPAKIAQALRRLLEAKRIISESNTSREQLFGTVCSGGTAELLEIASSARPGALLVRFAFWSSV